MPYARCLPMPHKGERVRCKQDGIIGTFLRYATENHEFPFIIEWDWASGPVTEACAREEFELLCEGAE